jgi:alpha-galactosidase
VDFPAVVALRADGASVVVELAGQVPKILHWGRDLGELSAAALEAFRFTAIPATLNNAVDVPPVFSLWPTESQGWLGTQAHEGHLEGAATAPHPRLTGAEISESELVVRLADDVSDVDIVVTYTLDEAGILAVGTAMTRRTGTPVKGDLRYHLAGVSAMLPLPRRATEILDFTGKWCRERAPQRRPVTFGSYVREVRRGKPGHDSPYLLTVGTPGFGFRTGEVWAVHVAWSGNQRYLAEQLPEGAGGAHAVVLGGGELLRPGEISLGAGETYASPTCYFAWSDSGLDGLADRFHELVRARSTHPTTPRPLVLNTWEAVYFDHDLDRLLGLAERAAAIGVERLVLDDGWFRGRRDDTAGLGDWYVDEKVWPQGLSPLADRVHELGMQFGLWVEPEMVNLDSRLARENPEWILGPSDELGPPQRHQYALNIAHEKAWAYLLERLDSLVTEYSVDYLKWDHNRDLHEAVQRDPRGLDRPGVHAQILALYRLLDALKERHPALEIESCAGGGGRIDLAILERTDRVWPSDCNDPLERQMIQRWTGQLVPPELVATHVSAAEAHTTGRHAALSFRLITALFGHAGIEEDLTRSSAEDLEKFALWAALYRELRPLLHSGRVVRGDLGAEATVLHGVVSADRTAAVFCWAQLVTAPEGQAGQVRFPGLAVDRDYRVRIRGEVGHPSMHQVAPPPWVSQAFESWVPVPGAVLVNAGLSMPTLNPEQAMLLEIRAV